MEETLVKDQKPLTSFLKHLDGKNYTAYKDIKETYHFMDFTLIIDYIQGDPFASPSRFRLQIPQHIAGFPRDTYYNKSRKIALADFLGRQFRATAYKLFKSRGTGKSGELNMPVMGPEIVERTNVIINEHHVEARFNVGLPARGRRILGLQAMELLCEELPQLVYQSLMFKSIDQEALYRQIETSEDADFIRNKLISKKLVAFVANGAILPRKSGIESAPLSENAIPFNSPAELEVSFECPNQGLISGMGIPQGITLIVGGGFHGKSTLLNAITHGIYNHIPGDGREMVITHPHAVKVKSEEGRNIHKVDISAFIKGLPNDEDTQNFATNNASGSTSQAANIMEALEVGAKAILIDEDTSATNFMIRDQRMQSLIDKEHEPITPFLDKIKSLYADQDVSTILVMGGTGDYFEVADSIIAMENYVPKDVTAQAKSIAEKMPVERINEGGEEFGRIYHRRIFLKSLDPSKGKKSVNIKTRRTNYMGFGKEEIELHAIDQLIDPGQLRAIAEAIIYFKKDPKSRELSLADILTKLDQYIKENGLHSLAERGDLVYFRPYEIAATINRHRGLIILD